MIKKFAFFGLIVVIVFFLLVGLSALTKDSPKEIMTINYTFMVKEGIGFNLDVDKLNFGGGPIGSTLQRKMNVSSSFDAFVHIKSVGPGNILLNQNDFNVQANESVELLFELIVPDMSLGLYEGTMFIYFYER